MNFNFSQKPDYTLNTLMIDELIRLYGTPAKFVFMDKVQDRGMHDDLIPEAAVFNDFKTLKTSRGVNGAIERDIWILLVEPEEYPNGLQFAFNSFGIINDDTLQAFVSLKSLDFIKDGDNEVHPKNIISNLIVFPNGKAMEITDCQLHVPGVNNKFIYSDVPSCYMLSMKSYSFDRSVVSSAIKNQGALADNESYVESFFKKRDMRNELVKEYATEDTLASKCNKDVIVNNKIDDVFGLS